jgi:hypothetical protein
MERQISQTTTDLYLKTFARYGEYIVIDPLKLVDKLISDGKSLSNINIIICALKWIEPNTEKRKGYSAAISDVNRRLKSSTNKYTTKFPKIKWENIPKPTGFKVSDAIIGLYTMIPPRRLEDYSFMTYVQTRPSQLNPNLNYFVSSEKKFIFQLYKTAKTYGKQEIDVPNPLCDLLLEYISTNRIADNSPLLKYREGSNGYSKGALLYKMKQIFGCGCDGLRHSYITYLYRTAKNLFNIEEVSRIMAHDVHTHLNYMDKEIY